MAKQKQADRLLPDLTLFAALVLHNPSGSSQGEWTLRKLRYFAQRLAAGFTKDIWDKSYSQAASTQLAGTAPTAPAPAATAGNVDGSLAEIWRVFVGAT
ncbi:hypothetical protein E4U55_004020 [Claviceps digitariae]|nr:hypothetical protein E4U55_004020 [Claviceps digitariae]